MSESPDGFIRSAGVISALTMLSRVLGLARDAVCAAFFGAGMVWDAFSFAFRVPNLFRRLFGEGALSAAFVPIFSEHLEVQEPEEAWRMAGRVAGSLALLLGGILLAGEAALVAALGLAPLSDRWHLTLLLTAVMLPYMLLICLAGLAGAALNSLKHFAAPALAPVVLNVVWIVAVVAVAPLVSADPVVRITVVSAAIVAAGRAAARPAARAPAPAGVPLAALGQPAPPAGAARRGGHGAGGAGAGRAADQRAAGRRDRHLAGGAARDATPSTCWASPCPTRCRWAPTACSTTATG